MLRSNLSIGHCDLEKMCLHYCHIHCIVITPMCACINHIAATNYLREYTMFHVWYNALLFNIKTQNTNKSDPILSWWLNLQTLVFRCYSLFVRYIIWFVIKHWQNIATARQFSFHWFSRILYTKSGLHILWMWSMAKNFNMFIIRMCVCGVATSMHFFHCCRSKMALRSISLVDHNKCWLAGQIKNNRK